VRCEDDTLSYACQYRISTVALAKSARDKNTCLKSRPAIVSPWDLWRQVGRLCSRLAWTRQVEFDEDSGVWSGGFWKSAGANDEGAFRAYQNTTSTHHSPALGSSHERLTCTTRLAAFHAAMCFQDFPATRIACRSLCRRKTLLIT
jgi:hypothetical protein